MKTLERIINVTGNVMTALTVSLICLLIFAHLFKIPAPASFSLAVAVFILSWQYIQLENKTKGYRLNYFLVKKRSLNEKIATVALLLGLGGTINQIFSIFWFEFLLAISWPLLIVAALFKLTAEIGIVKLREYFLYFSLSIFLILLTRLLGINIYVGYLFGAIMIYLFVIRDLIKSSQERKDKMITLANEIAATLLLISFIGSLVHLISGLNHDWQIVTSFPLIFVALIAFLPGAIYGAQEITSNI